ncbi:galactose-3-O-sulfotransferase 3-like isoform X2 [Mugil cephalus]|nr:galactose-3-O-sulfotransferase 3-like isoform X2 [Mugil cephalus]
MKAHLGCPALFSHPSLALKPKPKHTNVVFLKTHKTASSTIQNLLFRFAERNNLTVALPVQACNHQFCYPYSFTSRFVHAHTLPPNIVTNHMRFNKPELQHLMPNDTIYFTILREPGSMFESLFTYYNRHCETFQRVPNGSLEAFLEEPLRYYKAKEGYSMYAHNTLTFDLGGDKDCPATNVTYAQAFVAEVERVFSLVMIAEYFDESLVLLRHLLSWDLDDMVYFKLNMRTQNSKKSLTPSLHSKIRAWNFLDAQLYDHFNASLWRKLSAIGSVHVEREVQLLRQAQEKLMRSCFGDRKPLLRSAAEIKNKDLRPWKPKGNVDVVGYDLPMNLSHGFSSQAQELCLKLIMPEVRYTQLLLHSQSLRYCQSHQQQFNTSQQPICTVLPQHPQVHHRQPPSAAPGSGSGTGSTSTSKPAARPVEKKRV